MTDQKDPVELAQDLETSRRLTERDERETIDLLEQIDKQIVVTREYAQSWDGVNDDIAREVREEEKGLHELRAHVLRIINTDRSEVQNLIREIRAKLDESRGGSTRQAGADGQPA